VSAPTAGLGRCRALGDLTSEQLQALAGLMESREYAPGESLFREGDEAEEVLVIAQGSVRLQRERATLGVIGEGEMLGGVSMASVGRRACDAIAAEDVRALSLSRSAYTQLRADFPAIALALQDGLLREIAACVRALAESRASAA
jgi:CRP-like cAMP-binding protein